MKAKNAKHDTGGTALLEEASLDERVPDKRPDEAVSGEDAAETGLDDRTSNSAQEATQQFVTFIAGDEVFAADMSPVKEIIRVPEVVRAFRSRRPGEPARQGVADYFAAPTFRLS